MRFSSMVMTGGMLVALEEYKDIPFEIKRVYYMYDTKKKCT